MNRELRERQREQQEREQQRRELSPRERQQRLPADVWGLVLRTIAVLIAVLGVLDPALTRSRVSGTVVSVVHSGSLADSTQAASIAARLRAVGYAMVGARGAGDAASIVVGTARPSADGDAPMFVYAPGAVVVTAVDVPARVRLTSRVSVMASLAARRNASVAVELLENDRVVSRAERSIAADSSAVVALEWTPSSIGTRALTIRAVAERETDTVYVSRAVLVDSTRWRVLAYDGRPSWNATFVRRALERDGRFDVRSRVVTSRAPQALVARSTSRTPASLSMLEPRSVDVIVVGAPEALPAADLAALKRLVSNDGVSAVLLPDDATPSLTTWLGTGSWRSTPRRDAVAIRANAADSAATPTLRALVVSAPAVPPDGSERLLALNGGSVVWSQSVGRGEVVVNGALDAWRFRDATQSNFDGFWRDIVAAQAARRLPAISAEPMTLTLRPDERRAVRIDAATRPSIEWVGDSGSSVAVPVALPVASTSIGSGWVTRTPPMIAEGRGVLRVAAGGDSVTVPWVASRRAVSDVDVAPAVTRAWANARGGQVGTLDSLVQAVRRAGQARAEPLPWHPMRSGWWILPFTLALAADWWLRRRRGLP